MIIIGGNPSSGSTLLANILNNHPDIVCGPEMSLFNKKIIFDDYQYFKNNIDNILIKGYPTGGFQVYKEFIPEKKFYGLSNEMVREIVLSSINSKEFIKNIVNEVMANKKKIIFAEKTPSNTYNFDKIIELFPNAKIIHTIRDVRDTYCSLKKRNKSLFYSGSVWLYNNIVGSKSERQKSYMQIKYEQLVNQPAIEIERVLNFIGIDKTESILDVNHAHSVEYHKGRWNNSPSSDISNKSVGRYKNELSDNEINALMNISFKKSNMLNGSCISNVHDLMKYYGYDDIKYEKKLHMNTLIQYIKHIYARRRLDIGNCNKNDDIILLPYRSDIL